MKNEHIIWVGIPLTTAQRQRILSMDDSLTLIEAKPPILFAPMPPNAEIGFGWPRVEDVIASPSLRWLQLRGAGSDAYRNNDAIQRKNILLTTAHGVFDIAGAEHVLAMMLYFARRFDLCREQQRAQNWDLDAIRYKLGELHGQTIAIFGLGGFGREIARRAKALGMQVLGVKRSAPHRVENVDEVFGLEDVTTVVARPDHVVLTLPQTPDTTKFFTADLIGAMKSTAYLYNIARGGLVDEPALIDALRSKRIAGAGLDVFEQEPLPPDNPLWTLPNVLVTPHAAGRSPHEFDRMVDLFCDNLKRYLAGRPLRNLMDFERGY